MSLNSFYSGLLKKLPDISAEMIFYVSLKSSVPPGVYHGIEDAIQERQGRYRSTQHHSEVHALGISKFFLAENKKYDSYEKRHPSKYKTS